MQKQERLVAQPWAMHIDEVFERLETNASGLSENEAEKRLIGYGKNIFHSREKKSPLSIFLKQFISPLIFLKHFTGNMQSNLLQIAAYCFFHGFLTGVDQQKTQEGQRDDHKTQNNKKNLLPQTPGYPLV